MAAASETRGGGVVMSGYEALTGLAEESRTLSAVLLGLDAEEFQRPTNCPPWDLTELVVHTAVSIGLRGDLPDPEPAAPLVSATGYYQRPERATATYRRRNVQAARYSFYAAGGAAVDPLCSGCLLATR
jgi:hypothetical protein